MDMPFLQQPQQQKQNIETSEDNSLNEQDVDVRQIFKIINVPGKRSMVSAVIVTCWN
jgi:hypothetical protein